MKNVKLLLSVALLLGIGQAASGQGAKSDQARIARDKLRAAVQEICPVSGNKLGEHGTPIKVAVGKQKEEVFLCCKGCLKKEINSKHWATIHANIAKAQGNCPVMKKPLPKSPKWTVVEGQIVFVCCPPCTKKLAANPKPYLREIDNYYVASLKSKNKNSR